MKKRKSFLFYRKQFQKEIEIMLNIFINLFLMIILIGPINSSATNIDTIKIGALFSLTGDRSSIGIAQKFAAQLAVKEVNRNGGIGGHLIELIIRDTRSKGDLAVKFFDEIVSSYEVVAFIGVSSTDTGMAIKNLIEKNKIPTIMGVGGDEVILSGRKGTKIYGSADWIFKTPHCSSLVIKKLYMYLKNKNIHNIDLITSTDRFGRDGRRWLSFLSTKYGIINVNDEHFKPTSINFDNQLKKVNESRSEVVVCWTVGRPAELIAKQRFELKIIKPFFFNHGLGTSEFIEGAGEGSENIYMISTKICIVDQLKDEDPQKDIIKNVIAKYSNEFKNNNDIKFNVHSGYAWDAIQILINAIKKVGTDKQSIRNEIESTKNYQGVMGIYNINKEDHNGLKIDSLVLVQILNKKFVLTDY